MIRKMEEPNSETLFYSPTFKRYETINFYASLLNVLKQYTMIVDNYSPQIRRLVWTFIFQLLGQPLRSCDIPFTPIINSWLEEKSIDLMDIETYFTAFTQAQYSNPNLFPNFPPIPTTFNIPGISGPTTSFRIPKSQFDLINQIPNTSNNQTSPIKLNQNNIKSSFKQSPPQQQPQQQQPQQQFIPSIQLSKLSNNININNNNNKKSQNNSNTINGGVWSTELSSVFQQLSLLQSWSTNLERLSLAHKDIIWKTCRCFTNFINYDSTSFIRTFYNWSNDPVPNLLHITVMFAAIGYLKEMGLLRLDFCYPQSNVSVFNESSNNAYISGYGNNTTDYDEDEDEDGSPNIYDESGDISSDYSDSHSNSTINNQQNISSVQSSLNNSPYISPRYNNNNNNNNNNNINNINGLSTLNNSLLQNTKKRKSTEDINDLAVAASLSDPSTPNSPYKEDDNNNNFSQIKSCLPSLASLSASVLENDSNSDNQIISHSPKKIKLISPEVTDSESDSNESSKSSMNINSILCS